MKKQLIFSLLLVFAVAVFAPTVVMAIDNDVKVENLDNKEKKADKKADDKKAGECTQKAETKSADCTKTEAKKSDCAAKTDCGAKKADCSTKKAE